MADGIDISITGVESLLGKLSSISDDLRRRGGRAALRRAGNVIVEKAKANAARIDDPLTGRSIAANVAMRWNNHTFKTTGNLGFRIGVLHGAVLKKHPDLGENAPTPHWRLIEFGTENVRAQPFMRPAVESSVSEVVNVFATEYEKSIDRAIKRAAKKGVPP
ncbi:HK97-gp10 family putative phage morphogenesis protein [Enterobacter hormaechei]|uniref:HK97-gp10 family putative phage morphogenesis protein n=1 Tax=Enterobacter hormaechei TaxID=158836 RepID=UPI00287686D9|nr:HK97-gp10 family putative phage morphogenesis protein [Enterobacter hormaechei]MDR9880452.1 HK97 gp10 family phage protein [Enterobacter hormaechei subsp. steigerwaltii]